MSAFSSTALPPASPLFRGRQAELAHLTQICLGEVTAYRVIYGGHQNGKTSLLLQLEADLRLSVHVCAINFQRIPGATPSQVYAHIGQGIANALPMGVSAAQIADAPDLTVFLIQVLQRREIRRLVLLLDELGALPTATRTALGSALRALFQDRLNSPALAKLQIIFSGGIELYNLVVTDASSLHNVCKATYLEDLTRDEAVGLISDGLRAAGLSSPEQAISMGVLVYARVNGHPYLTQRIGELLVASTPHGADIGPEQVEHAERQIGQDGDPLLHQIQNDLHEHQLESAVRRLLTTPPRFTRLDDAMTRLELIGLAKRDGERWAPRNPLLAEVFREVLEVPAPAPTPAPAHSESDSAPHISVEIDDLRQEIAHFAQSTATVCPVPTVAPTATPVTPTATQLSPSSAASVTPSPPAPAAAAAEVFREVLDVPVPAQTPAPVRDESASATPVTPNATQHPPLSAISEPPIPPDPDTATVGEWARRYEWVVVIPFLLIIAVIAIPQTRSAVIGGMRQSTTVLRTPTLVPSIAPTNPPPVAPIKVHTDAPILVAPILAPTNPPVAPIKVHTDAPILAPIVAPAAMPVTPNATQHPPLSAVSEPPIPPDPDTATVGEWARRYGWVVIPFLLIIAVIAIPQTRSALIGGTSQPTPLPAWVPALVKVAAGPFLMGSTDADPLAENDEKPQHSLDLPDYWIGKTEVTNAQFRPFVAGDGYTNKDYWTKAGWDWRTQNNIVKPTYWDDSWWNGDTQPVVGISWFEAVAYCHWLSAQTGHEFRLPSEAEWEKAARGSDGRIWPWGNTWEVNRVNSKELGVGKTTPVGQYPNGASPYGALDMAGNASEWVATKYGKSYPYQLEDEWAGAYLEEEESRRICGGSYAFEQKYVRGAFRYYFIVVRSRVSFIGLRVASRSPLPGSGS